MGFKLVRTDSEEPCKIQLPTGTYLIGRGKLLNCDDKRVSRNHGELEVTDDSVSMKALHQNPCFFIKKGEEETQILQQNSIINLGNGDKFGLLPTSYWYEVLHCALLDIDSNSLKLPNSSENNQEENTEPIEDNNDRIGVDSENNTASEKQCAPGINDTIDDAGSPNPTSPSLLMEFQHSDWTIEAETGSPVKRCHSSESPNEAKKVKVEPEVKQEEPGETPGPSNIQGETEEANEDKKDIMLPPAPAQHKRERCMYGANCYRRNPQHQVQFSHPRDSDWGAGPRGECPYGRGCRRTDPRHWRDHTHPPGVNPPPPHPHPHRPQGNLPKRNVTKRRKDQKTNESSDEDIPKQDLIVTGKRTRKTIQRESWSGSESENEDPYQTDDSDEWQPSQNYTETQDTQDFDF